MPDQVSLRSMRIGIRTWQPLSGEPLSKRGKAFGGDVGVGDRDNAGSGGRVGIEKQTFRLDVVEDLPSDGEARYPGWRETGSVPWMRRSGGTRGSTAPMILRKVSRSGRCGSLGTPVAGGDGLTVEVMRGWRRPCGRRGRRGDQLARAGQGRLGSGGGRQKDDEQRPHA